MCDEEIQSRISRIETRWSDLRKAHTVDDAEAGSALETVLLRYRRAVYVYVLGIVRDPDVADEVFQEFAIRILRGAFRNAEPEKGRFRSLIKTTLANLITDQRRKQNRTPLALEGEADVPTPTTDAFAAQDEEFVREWREELLARTWNALAEEDQRQQQCYFAVLQYRASHPEATSDEMAAALGAVLKRTLTAAGVRQTLHRARERFAQLLVAEVARSLSTPNADRLAEEIAELGLLSYCKSALDAK